VLEVRRVEMRSPQALRAVEDLRGSGSACGLGNWSLCFKSLKGVEV